MIKGEAELHCLEGMDEIFTVGATAWIRIPRSGNHRFHILALGKCLVGASQGVTCTANLLGKIPKIGTLSSDDVSGLQLPSFLEQRSLSQQLVHDHSKGVDIRLQTSHSELIQRRASPPSNCRSVHSPQCCRVLHVRRVATPPAARAQSRYASRAPPANTIPISLASHRMSREHAPAYCRTNNHRLECERCPNQSTWPP